MGYDRRIGFEFLKPGPGYGGSCFPKDSAALLHTAQVHGYAFDLLEGVIEVNRKQYEHMVDKITQGAGGSLDGAVVGVWGLTFKSDTDDLRDSPSMLICERLLDAGAIVQAYDPAGGEKAKQMLPGLEIRADAYEAATSADVVAVLTEWDEFRWLDFDRLRSVVAKAVIVDARNLLDPAAMRRRGFQYTGVGR